jgi:hypothetical protein
MNGTKLILAELERSVQQKKWISVILGRVATRHGIKGRSACVAKAFAEYEPSRAEL